MFIEILLKNISFFERFSNLINDNTVTLPDDHDLPEKVKIKESNVINENKQEKKQLTWDAKINR